jgi:hypothetical protein
MPRPKPPRQGEPLSTNGILVPYSFWPTLHTTRWKLQRRLYVRDPWATLNEAVYRAEIRKSRIKEALSYIEQAEEYFYVGTQTSTGISVKPILLYYSLMNLAKSMLAVRNPGIDLSHAYHGLSATRKGEWAILGDGIRVQSSPNRVNVFGAMFQLLHGSRPSLQSLEVRHLLPQILPAHRLWTYACGRREQFVSVEIAAANDPDDQKAWLLLILDRGELAYLGESFTDLIDSSRLPGRWEQVSGLPDLKPWRDLQQSTSNAVFFEQHTQVRYTHRALDCVADLFSTVRPELWTVVTSTYPHRKYYLNFDANLGPRRLPQWASMYVLFYYLSDLTRYRPLHFDRFLESRYGPQIESILDECPRQFLYLMASELLQREVAPAGIA